MYAEAYLRRPSHAELKGSVVVAVVLSFKAFPAWLLKESDVTHGSKEQVIQRLREQAALGAPGGGTKGDCVTIEGLAPQSPADPGGQAEGLERPKAEEQAEEVQIPEEEVDWSEDKPQEPKKRRKIRRALKRQKRRRKKPPEKQRKKTPRRRKKKPRKSFRDQSQCIAQLLI